MSLVALAELAWCHTHVTLEEAVEMGGLTKAAKIAYLGYGKVTAGKEQLLCVLKLAGLNIIGTAHAGDVLDLAVDG